MSKLHLIPVPLSGSDISQICHQAISSAHNLRYFLAERSKTARQFIKSIKHPLAQSEIEVRELNDEDFIENKKWIKELVSQNQDLGLVSEAGLPCIADPGYNIVMYAHNNNIEVAPYPGPNSMLMALMASGLNGQEFSFHGYLPRKKEDLKIKLNEISKLSASTLSSQIFMETPYRNLSLLESILNHVPADLYLSISSGLGSSIQKIKTHKVREWKSLNSEYLNDVPAVFIIGGNRK
ncbi:MAG: SAM-dependent methyltransferase [Saprospiraceae bacterium]|nr:SAM-dependent methyltransferase [Saprospiraceae bacterium]